MHHDPLYRSGFSRFRIRSAWGFYGLMVVLAGVLILLATVAFVGSFRWINPSVSAYMIHEDWQELGVERYDLTHYWNDYDELPDHLKWAVIASEDQQFYDHHGFDIESIKEAWEDLQEGTRTRGASTISQQVARNMFLWPDQSWVRKGLEAVLTVMVEVIWPKERILEVYLNIAEFGPGLYGIGKASQEYFGNAPSQIEPDASARFAAVLPEPKRMRVEPPTPFVEERSKWILAQMSHITGVSYLPEEEEPEVEPEFEPADDPHPPGFQRGWEEDSLQDTIPTEQVENDSIIQLPDTLRQEFR